MNIKLQKLIMLFNQRKTFFNNHPDTYRFVKDIFSAELEEGTKFQIIVREPKKQAVTTEMVLQSSDMKFVDGIREIIAK